MNTESALRGRGLAGRPASGRRARDARWLWDVRLLPRPVAWFYLRADATAARIGDSVSSQSALAPRELARLLEIVGEHEEVVELGTGGAWTAIALALGDEVRQVIAFDPVIRIERVQYLELVRPGVRARIDFRPEPFEHAPRAVADRALVVVDGSRGEDDPVVYLSAQEIVRPGGTVVVHSCRAEDDVLDALFPDARREVTFLLWRKPLVEEPPAKRRRLRSAPRLAAIVLAGLALGAGAGAAISLLTSDDEGGSGPAGPPVARTAGGGRAGAAAGGGSNSTVHRARRAQTAARSARGLHGRGATSIGTLNIDRPSFVRWRTTGERLTISSQGSRLNRPRRRGFTLLSPGSYPGVKVSTTGSWALTIRPRRPR